MIYQYQLVQKEYYIKTNWYRKDINQNEYQMLDKNQFLSGLRKAICQTQKRSLKSAIIDF